MSDDLYGIPTLPELLEAVQEWLDEQSGHSEPGDRWAFDARVAANILAMAGRELELGAEHRRRHAERLAALGVSDDRALAARIRSGVDRDESRRISAALRDAVDDRLAVCDPRRLNSS
ncbi:MAG: hypothetical protein H0X22_10610 [Acidimicrobiia bacterium]|nr:hypothetical protein [Acidimicrobiia bacterium]MBA3803337.1 hypothetical protein [Acidimicrobiia bacterium]